MVASIRALRRCALLLTVFLPLLAGCGGGEVVTTAAIGQARARWEQARIRDYELEWMSSGASRSHYLVTVRDGVVGQIQSIQPGGRTVMVHPAEARFYGVEGLFMIIADELAQLKTGAPFGQPKGTKAILRFTPDPKLGYPRSYRRDVMGTPLALAIDVIRLEPKPPSTTERRAP